MQIDILIYIYIYIYPLWENAYRLPTGIVGILSLFQESSVYFWKSDCPNIKIHIVIQQSISMKKIFFALLKLTTQHLRFLPFSYQRAPTFSVRWKSKNLWERDWELRLAYWHQWSMLIFPFSCNTKSFAIAIIYSLI